MRSLYTILSIVLMVSCSKQNSDRNLPYELDLIFTHHWDGEPITSADLNELKFTNQNGNLLSISRLRYLVSKISVQTANGVLVENTSYNLTDLSIESSLNQSITLNTTERGASDNIQNLSFTFGFDNNANMQSYADLNSANWNVPDILGGGYHYMQMDGMFINTEGATQGYNYHCIRAVDSPGNPTFPQDTFFEVQLGSIELNSNKATIEIQMNVAEWFKNPNQWNLNQYHQMLMANSTAQILMFENGQNVFTIGAVTE